MIKEFENISDTVCSITTADRINDKWENEKDYNIEHDVLLPCPKCGGVPDLRGKSNKIFGTELNLVNIVCTHCNEIKSDGIGYNHWLSAGDRGTDTTDYTAEEAVRAVVSRWNKASSLSEYRDFQHPKKTTLYQPAFWISHSAFKEGYGGDCLEGIGLPSVGTLEVNPNLMPVVGDLVRCNKILRGMTLVKQVIEITEDKVIVGTRYADSSRDYTFVAGEISGTVTKAFDRQGNIVYEREPTKAEV